MPEKIMLLDGNSLINRAFYAIPVLTNAEGEFTNAVYGFMNIFFKLYDEEKPDYIGIAFDLPKPTFRHKLYAEYKGTRKSMPDELRSQLPLLKSLLRLMDLKIYEQEGYEADDILGTLSKKAEAAGVGAVIVSGDRDMLQCATNTIKIRIPKTKSGKTEVEDYTESDVIEKLGVTPSEFIDVKALMGDTSDNIPGVPGIGEKTAYKIIQKYKTLENALEKAAEIKPKKASENLQQYKEQAILSQTLARINTAVPIELNITEAKPQNIYAPAAYNEVARLGFKALLQRFASERKNIKPVEPEREDGQLSLFSPQFQANTNIDTDKKMTVQDAEKIISSVLEQKTVAYKLIYNEKALIGASFSYSNNEAGYFISANIGEETLISICKPFFESEIEKITIDAKHDIVYLNKYNTTIKNIIFDEMLAAYILNASDRYEYNDIALAYLRENYISLEMLFGKGKNKLSVSENETSEFSVKQASIIWRVYPIMKERLAENSQDELYYNIELPLLFVLADMEISGIKADRHALIEYGKNLDTKIDVLQLSIYKMADEVFNINSPKQLGVILFEKLGLKGGKKTKVGSYSTGAEILEELTGENPIIDAILEYRAYTKLKSTYVEGLLAVMDDKTGKIHSTFNQTITSTGRISSTEPNLQNIPVRTELGRQLRKVFIPSEKGYVFLDADYSQIELRILAHLSGDETFIKAFNENQDIHRLTASQVFHIPFSEVTQEQRRYAKAVNFGIVYGISAFSLSKDINVSVKEAERYISGYFEKYPNVKKYLDETISAAKETGYASTLLGRRRAIPELQSGNYNTRSFGERAAMNMPVQGTAADVIKIAMVKVYNRLKAENMKSRLILQVHDELLLEAYEPELPALKEILKNEMENALKLQTVLEIDMHSGANWLDAK